MTNRVRRPATAGPALILAAVLCHPLTHAQAPAASGGAGAEQVVSERVRKDAASPLYWIRLNAQSAGSAPAKPAPRIAETRPAIAAARPAPRRAAGDGGGNQANAAAGGGSEIAPARSGPAPDVATELLSPGALAVAPPPLIDDANEPLTLVSGAEPEFPTGVMRRLRKGTVQVSFEVRPDGSVGNATVVQPPMTA